MGVLLVDGDVKSVGEQVCHVCGVLGLEVLEPPVLVEIACHD